MVGSLDILRREREFCLAVKNSGIVCGVFDGSIALPSQKHFIEAILSEASLLMKNGELPKMYCNLSTLCQWINIWAI